MTDVDFEILGLKSLLAASKRRAFKENILARARMLVNFLQSRNLTTRTLLGRNEVVCEDFQLMKSDLTPEGFELVRRGLSKWDRMIESGLSVDDVSPLEHELSIIRAQRN